MNKIILVPYEPQYATSNDVLLCIKTFTSDADGKTSRCGDLHFGGVAYYCKREYFQPINIVVVSDEEIDNNDIVLCQDKNGVFTLDFYNNVNSSNFTFIKKVVASSLQYKNVPQITNVDEFCYYYNEGNVINQIEVGEEIVSTQAFRNENLEPVNVISYEEMFKERYLNKFVRVWKTNGGYWFNNVEDYIYSVPVIVYVHEVEYDCDSLIFFNYEGETYSLLIEFK